MKKKHEIETSDARSEFEIEIVPADEWHDEVDDLEIDAALEGAWVKREWRSWLTGNLTFPFRAVRNDGDDADLFGSELDPRRIVVGAEVEVMGLAAETGRWGILARVRHRNRTASVPLADLSARPKSDKNFRPVLEYSVAVANGYTDVEI